MQVILWFEFKIQVLESDWLNIYVADQQHFYEMCCTMSKEVWVAKKKYINLKKQPYTLFANQQSYFALSVAENALKGHQRGSGNEKN